MVKLNNSKHVGILNVPQKTVESSEAQNESKREQDRFEVFYMDARDIPESPFEPDNPGSWSAANDLRVKEISLKPLIPVAQPSFTGNQLSSVDYLNSLMNQLSGWTDSLVPPPLFSAPFINHHSPPQMNYQQVNVQQQNPIQHQPKKKKQRSKKNKQKQTFQNAK